MNEKVLRSEKLYRVVKRSRPDVIDNNGKPTSALFKQDDGVSVDRDGNRSEDQIIKRFREYFGNRFKGLACVGADVCIDNNMAVIPNPTENEYHAEIFNDINKTPLNQLNALILADCCEMVYLDKDFVQSKL